MVSAVQSINTTSISPSDHPQTITITKSVDNRFTATMKISLALSTALLALSANAFDKNQRMLLHSSNPETHTDKSGSLGQA
jgi:hypothetical protein